MVSREAKWILGNVNIDPKKVADTWGITEKECLEYIIDLDIALRAEEKAYDPVAVQKEVREWVNTIPDKNNIRIEAIKDQLIDAKTNPKHHDIPRLIQEVKVLKGTSEHATPQMIERAKQFPLGKLIELKRNTALCPFHNEKTPSFSVKNNKYKCFGCGVSGDSLSLAMHLKGMTFKQAVDYLQ